MYKVRLLRPKLLMDQMDGVGCDYDCDEEMIPGVLIRIYPWWMWYLDIPFVSSHTVL